MSFQTLSKGAVGDLRNTVLFADKSPNPVWTFCFNQFIKVVLPAASPPSITTNISLPWSYLCLTFKQFIIEFSSKKRFLMPEYVAGIDFGTTNSSAAISDGKTVRMVDVENGKDTIPTALFFPDKSNQVYYGRNAQNEYTSGDKPGRFMRSMKRVLGSPLMRGSTVVSGKSMRFDAVVGYFVKYLKQQIDKAAGRDVECVVMGRPVHFRDNDPEGDKRAEQELEKIAIAAGFKQVAFQYEPIAAAFAHEQDIKSDKLAFVVDIGGGTSDFTVIRLSPERKLNFDRASDVLANTGVRIGGNDFDKALSMKSFMPCFGLGTEYRSYNKNISLPTAPFISLSTWSSVNDVYNYKTLNMVKGYVVWGLEPEKTKRLWQPSYRRSLREYHQSLPGKRIQENTQ